MLWVASFHPAGLFQVNYINTTQFCPHENLSFWPNPILASSWHRFNKLLLTNTCLLWFSVFPDIFTPFLNQWYIKIYEPIIPLINLSCPCYSYFHLIFSSKFVCSLFFSPSRTLCISLCPLADPSEHFPLARLREIQINAKHNALCGFHIWQSRWWHDQGWLRLSDQASHLHLVWDVFLCCPADWRTLCPTLPQSRWIIIASKIFKWILRKRFFFVPFCA